MIRLYGAPDSYARKSAFNNVIPGVGIVVGKYFLTTASKMVLFFSTPVISETGKLALKAVMYSPEPNDGSNMRNLAFDATFFGKYGNNSFIL